MSDFDALFCVVLRIRDYDGKGLEKKLDKQTQKLIDILGEEYTDCFVVPVATELVESPTDNLKILDSFLFVGDEE